VQVANRLKILHIIPNLKKGGAERLVLDICTELASRQGIEVKLVVFSDSNDYLDASQYVDLSIIDCQVRLSVLKKNKIQVNKLQSFIDNFQPDIIHSHLFMSEIVSRSCYYPKAKWYSHCHDNMVQLESFGLSTLLNKNKLTNFYEKNYLLNRYKKNGGTNFLAISNDTKSYFSKNILTYTTTLLHNAINFNKFFKPLNFDVQKSKLNLVCTGSLVDKKNQIFLVDVVDKIKEKNIDVQLDILGEGVNRNKIETEIKNKNLEENIFLRGNVNNVEEYLWNADIYTHSATYEPLGLVLIEAMAAGLPVVCLDGKGNKDLMENGKNGYLITKQNASFFADKILDIWNDKKKHQEMSEYAQEYAKNYDIKNYVEKLLKIYNG